MRQTGDLSTRNSWKFAFNHRAPLISDNVRRQGVAPIF